MFSVLADETKDISKKEQMSIILQYVDDKGKHFLTFVHAVCVNAESLTKYIVISSVGSKFHCFSGVRCASVMSGQYRNSGMFRSSKYFVQADLYEI